MAKRKKTDNLDGFKPTHIEIGFNTANQMWEVVQCFIPGAGFYTTALPTLEEAKDYCALALPLLEVVVIAEGQYNPCGAN